MPMPDIARHPRLWFQFLAGNRNGIERQTLVQALEAVLPLDTEALREALADGQCWSEPEAAQGASPDLTETQFFAPGGLLEWVRGHQHELQAAKARGPPPPLSTQPECWFRHFDVTKRGRLRRGDVLRGLCETAAVSSLDTRKVSSL